VHYCGTRQVPLALLVAYLSVRVFAPTASGHTRLTCYVVHVKMALWIMVLSLGTFGPSESVSIVDSAVLFSKKKE